MKIVHARLIATNIAFNLPFNHASHSRDVSRGLLLALTTDDGSVGYGEALPRPYVTGETNESVAQHAIDSVLPSLMNQPFESFSQLLHWLQGFHSRYDAIKNTEVCIKTLVELALLDAWSKSSEQPIAKLLGYSTTSEFEYTGVITSGNPKLVERYISAFVEMGIRVFKLKVGSDREADLNILNQLKAACPYPISIRVDANEAWVLAEACDRIVELAGLGVEACEQPMPATDNQDYPELVRRLDGAMDVCIDESLCTLADAQWFIDNRATNGFNLRVSKNGGIVDTVRIAKLAEQAGLFNQIGSQVGETSILTRAAQIVAGALTDIRFLEGAFGTHLLSYDITPHPVMFGARGLCDATRHTGLGLGVEVDVDLLKKATEQIMWEGPITVAS